MTRYLLAAEADQIQDFLFRCSRLREVVGGSQLLSRFCEEATCGLPADDVVVSDGGAFRLLFNDRDSAEEFGRRLAEEYRHWTDGTLTVANPVECPEAGFAEASREANRQLRRAKHRGDPATTPAHLPYTAFCASCGVGLAGQHTQLFKDERANYHCDACRVKAEARRDEQRRFLDLFLQAVRSRLPEGERDRRLALPREVEEVACLDPRNHVAYLKADANGMGAWFSRCQTKEQMRRLSQALTEILRKSLAEPCPNLLRRLTERRAQKESLPVLPLILGGDDCFALLPARWALDLARRFCVAFEGQIVALGKELKLGSPDEPAPTIAAAVVVCKGTYPHRLAHRRCEALLHEAKQVGKSCQPRSSMLNFEVVSGNSLSSGESEAERDVWRTIKPYTLPNTDTLLKQRLELRCLPGKRRAQLRRFFDDLPARMRQVQDEALPAFQELLARIGRDRAAGSAVTAALQALGDPAASKPFYWRRVTRQGEQRDAHGLPDLIEAWSFGYRLDTPATDYEEE
jgi:hypothetical protein